MKIGERLDDMADQFEEKTQELLVEMLSENESISDTLDSSDIEYSPFIPENLGLDIFLQRYASPGETNWATRCRKIADHVAAGESEEKRVAWRLRFYRLVNSGDFVPGGRILFGCGRARSNLLNCYVLIPEDSVESIGKTIQDMYRISCSGGGIGFNFSNIRPKGDHIQNIHNSAPGSISVMKMINEVGNHVRAGKSRRTALMGILNIDHPDILEFLHVKLDLKELTNFNISVAITERFIEACEKNEPWYFYFSGKKYNLYTVERQTPVYDENGEKTTEITKSYINIAAWDENDAVARAKQHHNIHWEDRFTDVKMISLSARDLFKRIWINAVRSGDPGILNLSLANSFTNVSYFESLNATNPCVTGDTWVMTDKGARQIDDLMSDKDQGNVNYVVDGNVYEGTRPWKSGDKPVFKLTTEEGYSLKLTEDHKVMTTEGWKESGKLVEGDRILLHNHTGFDTWGDVDDEAQYDGYLLGHLVGDGTFNKDGAILSVWDELGSKEVKDHISFITNFMEQRLDFRGFREVNRKNLSEDSITESRLTLKSVTDLAASYGIVKGNKTITKQVERASDSFQRGFLGALFDTDGSVQGTPSKGLSIRLSQSNLDLLEATQRMLAKFGIKSSIYKRRDAGSKLMPDGSGGQKEYSYKTQYDLVISCDAIKVFMREIGFINSHKEAKCNSVLLDYSKAPKKTKFESKFKSLEPLGVMPVYDLTVSEVHKFDANGMVISNCGEQFLPHGGNCCLGHVNLSNMVNDSGDFDWRRFKHAIRRGVRFLDNVLEVNNFPIPETREIAHRSRRIGLGVMGYHHMLLKLGIAYGSEKCLEFTERLAETFRNESYLGSILLAKERGSFREYDKVKYMKEGFVKTLPPRIKMAIKKYGIRNAVINSIAPTGTTSMVMNVSSSIEPIFSPMYFRRFRQANVWREEVVLDPMFKKYLDEGKDITHFTGAYDVSFDQHLAVQVVWQRYIDSAISKTCNCPENTKPEDFFDTMLDYAPYLKGVTVYRAGSKGDEPLKAIPTTPENIKKYATVENSSVADGASCSLTGGDCG